MTCIGLSSLQQELGRDYGQVNVNELCRRDSGSNNIKVVCFQQAGTLFEFVADFGVLTNEHHSELFVKVWKNVMSTAISGLSKTRVDDIYSKVWQPCLQHCTRLLTSLADLSIKFVDIDFYFQEYQQSLHPQLLALFKGITLCNKGEPADWKKIEAAMDILKLYWSRRVCYCRRVAETFLQIRDSLGLTGDFSPVLMVYQYINASTMILLLLRKYSLKGHEHLQMSKIA